MCDYPVSPITAARQARRITQTPNAKRLRTMKTYQIKTVGSISNGNLNGLNMILDGCPTDGLAAIDWRIANGLPGEPTNRVVLSVDIVSATLARKYASRLNSDAALTITDCTGHTAQICIPYLSPVPAKIALGILKSRSDEDAVASLIDHCLGLNEADRLDRARKQAENPIGLLYTIRNHYPSRNDSEATIIRHIAEGGLLCSNDYEPEAAAAVQAAKARITTAAMELRRTREDAEAVRRAKLLPYLDAEQTAMQARGLLNLPDALAKIEARLDREAADAISGEIAPPQTEAEVLTYQPTLATTATRGQFRTLRAVERRLGKLCQLLQDGRILTVATTADGREIRLAIRLAE